MITLNDIDKAVLRLLRANQKEFREIESIKIQIKVKDKILPMVLKEGGIYFEEDRK